MNKTIYLLFLIAIFGCTQDYEYVRFETSQPEGVKPSVSFRKNMIGEYNHCSDSSQNLSISQNQLIRYRKYPLKFHRDELELDSSTHIDKQNNSELKAFLEREGFLVEILNDTIKGIYTNTDTIFSISEHQLLKKLKGDYYLNFKKGESNWRVKQLRLKKDTLLIGQITPSDTLLSFDFATRKTDSTTSKRGITTEYLIKPNRKDFRSLLKKDSFQETECYCKKKS